MKRQIKKVAVLGSGVMGCGIAALLTGVGINVCLFDIVPNELTDKEKSKGLTLNDKAVRNRIAQANKDLAFTSKTKIAYSKKDADLVTVCNLEDDLEKLTTCDWIIEVVVERLDVKKALMEKIYKYWNKKAIVSTNTSGVEIHKIVQDMPDDFKRNFLGTHFFNPVRHMKLLEIIPIDSTDKDIVCFLKNFAHDVLGKGVVTAKDTPCFVANRIGAYSNAVVLNTMKKYNFNIKDVDVITGAVMGRPRSATFKTIDIVGLDTFVNVFKNLQVQIKDEEERKMFILPKYIEYLMENRFLGDKTKQGFYKKTTVDGKKVVLAFDINALQYCEMNNSELLGVKEAEKEKNLEDKMKTLIYGAHEDSKFAWDVIKNVLLYSAKKVPEITDDFELIDKGMMWGYNWLVGPFKIWDMIGFHKSVEKMIAEKEEIPQWILDRYNKEVNEFYPEEEKKLNNDAKIIFKDESAMLTDIGDGITCFTFLTKSNSITEGLIDSLEKALDIVESDYLGMITVNEGKNFSVGFDLKRIVKFVEEEDWETMSKLSLRMHNVYLRMKYSKRYMVSAPFGSTVGGGAEYVMHTHGVVAAAETYMGLVEAGVGLVPGIGGIKEYLCRAMAGIDKFDYVEAFPKVRKMWNLIANGTVTSSAHEAIDNGMINQKVKIVMNRDLQMQEAKKMILQMIENNEKMPIKTDIPVLGKKGYASLLCDNINTMKGGNFISEYDAFIAERVAWIITGGDLPTGTLVSEDYILGLERQVFAQMCKQPKTKERVLNMLATGKVLRN